MKTQKCAGGGHMPLTIVLRLCYTKYIELVVGPAFFVPEGEKKKDAAFRSLPLIQTKNLYLFRDTGFGPSVEIRTQGLLNPIQARYQTSPHPD